MSDPVVTIKVRFEPDLESARQAGAAGANAAQGALGNGVGQAGRTAATTTQPRYPQDESSPFQTQFKRHMMEGGHEQALDYVRKKHALVTEGLSRDIAERQQIISRMESGRLQPNDLQTIDRLGSQIKQQQGFANKLEGMDYDLQRQINRKRVAEDRAAEREERRQEKREQQEEIREQRRAAKLDGASFQADISELSPSQQRRELLSRAKASGDPLEAAMLRRQAGQLSRKTGLNREIMGTGNYMNLMFGGWEVASGINAMLATNDASARSSSMAQLAAQKNVIDTVGGGIIGSMVSAAWDVPDAVSRLSGGKGFDWSIRSTRDAIFGAQQSQQDLTAATARAATSRATQYQNVDMFTAGMNARDNDPFRRRGREIDASADNRMRDYDEELMSLRDAWNAESDNAKSRDLAAQYDMKKRGRDAYLGKSEFIRRSENVANERARSLARQGFEFEQDALRAESVGGFGRGERLRVQGRINLEAEQFAGTEFSNIARRNADKASMAYDRAFEWQKTLGTRGLAARFAISDILAQGGPNAGGLASIRGIFENSRSEALAAQSRGDEEGVRAAIAIGKNNLKAFREDYFRNVTAEEANPSRTNLSGPGTSDANEILKAIDERMKKFESLPADVQRIADNIQNLGTAQ